MTSYILLLVTAGLLAAAAVCGHRYLKARRRVAALKRIREEAEFLRPLLDKTVVAIHVAILFNDTRAQERALKRLRVLEHRWKREISDKLNH